MAERNEHAMTKKRVIRRLLCIEEDALFRGCIGDVTGSDMFFLQQEV